MGRNSKIAVPYLPQELVEMIAKCLDNETDILRFRAVCNLWRNSTTPLKKIPFADLRLPFTNTHGGCEYSTPPGSYFRLAERTVYRVGLPESEEPKFWLVKVEKLSNGKLRILNPVSDHQILPGIQMPKVLNTLDFRVSEVCRTYSLRFVDASSPDNDNERNYAKKVTVLDNVESGEYSIMLIDLVKNLLCIKSGDEKWTKLPLSRHRGVPTGFVDVVNHKGQFYGMDARGYSWKFDSKFNSTRIANHIHFRASRRKFIELYNGELHLVEEVKGLDRGVYGRGILDGCKCPLRMNSRFLVRNTTMEIKIKRFNEQEREWVEGDQLNDVIVFAGDDCAFFVSGKEFGGCSSGRVFYPSRCICFQTDEERKLHYFTYLENGCCNSCGDIARDGNCFVPIGDVQLTFRGLHGHNTAVCDFATGKMGSLLRFPEFAAIFWPPPSWLTRT